MRRTLVDTGPLVALCDTRDRLHRPARAQLARLRAPLQVCLPVVTEALHFLDDARLRARCDALFEDVPLV
jgi:hypothetical protein